MDGDITGCHPGAASCPVVGRRTRPGPKERQTDKLPSSKGARLPGSLICFPCSSLAETFLKHLCRMLHATAKGFYLLGWKLLARPGRCAIHFLA